MKLRIDPNKELHIDKISELYSDKISNELIQIFVRPSLCRTNVNECKAILFLKRLETDNIFKLQLSTKNKDGYLIFESILGEELSSQTGIFDIWVEVLDINTKLILKSSMVGIYIKSFHKTDNYNAFSTVETKPVEINGLATERVDYETLVESLKKELLFEVDKFIAFEIDKIKSELKMELSKLPQLHKVSETGSYKDLLDTPDIQSILPTALSELDNDCGFVNQKQIDEHDVSDASHKDIRDLIDNLKTEVSDDKNSINQIIADIDYLTTYVGMNLVSVEKMKEYYTTDLWNLGAVQNLVYNNIIHSSVLKQIIGDD